MISIIICSINPSLYFELVQNIKETIGIEYEIIKIDNKKNNFGISKAYNLGAKKSKFPYVCFIHEDIKFKTKNWGINIINLIQRNTNFGLIGVAGSVYKSKVPSIWSQGLFDTDYQKIIQHFQHTPSVFIEHCKKKFVEVKTLDGVFLFTTKQIWEAHKFDENTFDKFHCYDLDFSLQIGQHHSVVVYNGILIEHFSSGSLNKDWVKYSINLSKKWEKKLPIGNLNRDQQKEIEWRNRKIFFLRMHILGYPLTKCFKYFFKWDFLKNTSISNLFSFLFQLLGQKAKLISKKPFY